MNNTKKIVTYALVIAIILLMSFTPLGYLKMPGIEISLLAIPVAVGAILLGPEAGAVFGGVFGTVLAQGVKRGLMSNEAGQGTITMPAAASDAEHPCDQGCVQAIGVFLDTMVICTLTGFVVVMGRVWQTPQHGLTWANYLSIWPPLQNWLREQALIR